MMGRGRPDRGHPVAILNANYIARRWRIISRRLFAVIGNLVAHECILDLRRFKNVNRRAVGQAVWRLRFSCADAGRGRRRHADGRAEPRANRSSNWDRFCDAMISIQRGKCRRCKFRRRWTMQNNLLNKPPANGGRGHWRTIGDPALPARIGGVPGQITARSIKFWPAIGRIDNVFGDRNPVCSCAGLENYS